MMDKPFICMLNALSATQKERYKALSKYLNQLDNQIVVTTVLNYSSSTVIILTIVLVNADTLNFKQVIGIVMGANIGTTISSQIVAMDVGKYSPTSLIIGLALLIISRNQKISRAGKVLLYFGMLFFGLYTMENAVEPLKVEPQFSE